MAGFHLKFIEKQGKKYHKIAFFGRGPGFDRFYLEFDGICLHFHAFSIVFELKLEFDRFHLKFDGIWLHSLGLEKVKRISFGSKRIFQRQMRLRRNAVKPWAGNFQAVTMYKAVLGSNPVNSTIWSHLCLQWFKLVAQ